MPHTRPAILFIMTDQQRFDTIAAIGNSHIYTPNMDRLVRRGISFSNAYATCPVCGAARYTIRTGCEPPTTRVFTNVKADPVAGQPFEMKACCGPYLARVMSGLRSRTFESESSTRIHGMKTEVTKRCGAVKKRTIRLRAKVMTMVHGSLANIR